MGFFKHCAAASIILQGFPGGSVVRNLPTSVGDVGSIPGPGRSHIVWSNSARAPQLLSACYLESLLHNKRNPCSEESMVHKGNPCSEESMVHKGNPCSEESMVHKGNPL